MTIRIAVKKDLKSITNLYKQTIKDELFKFPTIYINRHIQRHQIIILEKNGNLVGCYIWKVNKIKNPISMKRSKNAIVWLEQIMVFPEHQGNGFGKEIMDNYLKIKSKEYRLVCKENLIEFYKKFGFVVVETIISDKQQKVIMSKSI